MKLTTIHQAGPLRPRALFVPLVFFLALTGQAGSDAERGGGTNTTMTVGPSKIPPPRFEAWPLPPPRATNALVRPGGEAPDKAAPGTAAGEKRLYEFQADNIELKAALALFARANNLNIVPDQDATGVVTLNVRNLSLERMMQAMLEANDLSWTEEDGLIRVRTVQSRDFTVDYLRLVRNGQGSSAVTLSSSSITSGGGSGGGSQGGGGQGGGGGAGGGGGGAGGGGAAGGVGGQTGSQMNLKLDNAVEFWKELEEQLAKLLTARGKDTIAINRTAGIIQVTDRPSALKRVEDYLKQLSGSVSRQVDIEAKLYDVTLGDQFQFGINWARVATVGGGQFGALASPLGTPLDLTTVTPAASPGGGFDAKQSSITMLFSNRTSAAVLEALQEQGEVNVISQPRLRAMNNQTAIMKVGTDRPFFTQQTQTTASAAAQTTQSGDLVSIITIGTVLAVTPQIGGDGWITLDITPAITSFVEERKSPSGLSSAPVLDIKQSSTIVRLRDGETIVMGGLIQNSSAKSVRKVPLLGDIPWLGKLFQGRIEAKQKKELVIFLTPTLVQ